MAAVLFLLAIVLVAVAAPFLGADRTDARSEKAHPDAGWYPVDAGTSHPSN